MSIIKGDLVIRALKMLGVVDSITSPDPTEIADGLEMLESMVQSWGNTGISIAYLPAAPDVPVDPGDESGILDGNVIAVASNLACHMAPLIGREAPMTIKVMAKQGYDGLFSVTLTKKQSDPMMPTGVGNCYLGGYQAPDQEPTP